MLKRSSELMQAFIDYEVSVLADMPMPHMPTLGDGYEAIQEMSYGRTLPYLQI